VDQRSVQRALGWRLARLQAGLGCAAGIALAPLGGIAWLLAAAGGGVLQGLLSVYVVARMGTARPDPAGLLGAFYRAQIGKWLWALLVFGVTARCAPGLFLPVLAGYGAGLIGNWLALRWAPERALPGRRGT
jgi:hypothetical protein